MFPDLRTDAGIFVCSRMCCSSLSVYTHLQSCVAHKLYCLYYKYTVRGVLQSIFLEKNLWQLLWALVQNTRILFCQMHPKFLLHMRFWEVLRRLIPTPKESFQKIWVNWKMIKIPFLWLTLFVDHQWKDLNTIWLGESYENCTKNAGKLHIILGGSNSWLSGKRGLHFNSVQTTVDTFMSI